jgi:hypothetical protein
MSSGAPLPTGWGPRTRDLWRSRELTRQPGPSPRRPSRAPLTRQSWGPELQSSRQAQRARTVQRPVYYISEVLHEAKMRYLEVHKLLYAVLITSKKQYAYINEVYKFLIKNMEKILHLCPWNK